MGQNFEDYLAFQQIPGMPILLQHCVSSCHIPTPGALILNHLQEAKATEKSWSLATYSKNAICCWDAAVLHRNAQKIGIENWSEKRGQWFHN